MVVIDDLKNLILYKKQFFLPIDENDKKKNSAIMLLTPNYQSSINAMNAPYMINRRYFESYYLEKNIYRYINSKGLLEKPVTEEFLFNINEAELTAKKRNALPDSEFGLPEKRKYPMPDKEHVLLAIKFFNHVDKEDEKKLANNIIKKIKEFKMKNLRVGDANKFFKYWYKEFNESVSSTIKSDYVSKGKKSLSDFKKIDLNETNVKEYKKDASYLSHFRYDNPYVGYIWINNESVVCGCVVNEDTNTIQAIEVSKDYQGYGLSRQILDVCKSLGGYILTVNKSNEVATSLYKKYGFEIYKETESMNFMVLKGYEKYITEAVSTDRKTAMNAVTVALEKNGLKAHISKNGEWGSDQFISGKDNSLCLGSFTKDTFETAYKIAKSAVNKDEYRVSKDNYFTIFIKAKDAVTEGEYDELELSYYFPDDMTKDFNNTVDMSSIEDEPINENSQVKIETCSAIIMDNNGRILIEKHNRTGTLSIPGGKVDQNETSLSGLERELKEELDIEVENVNYMYSFTFGFNYINDPTNYLCTDHLYFVKKYNGSIKNAEESKHGFIKFMSIEEIVSSKDQLSKILKRFIAQFGNKLSKDPAAYLSSFRKKSNVFYTGYQNDISTAELYINMNTLKDAFDKCGVKYPSSKITVIVSGSESDYGYIDDNNITILSKSVFERLYKDISYDEYTRLVSMIFVYHTVNPAVADTIVYPLSIYKSGNADKGIDEKDKKYYQESVFKYIDTKYGNKEILDIVKTNNVKKLISYAKEMSLKLHTESMEYVFNEDADEQPATPEDLQNLGKNITRRIKQSSVYKLNKIKRDIEKGNTGAEKRVANTYQKLSTGDIIDTDISDKTINESFNVVSEWTHDQHLSDENVMYFFEDTNYDMVLRKSLYKDRIRTSKQILDIYKQVKRDCPFIKWTYIDLKRYLNRNIFFDLSYYNESYFRNMSEIVSNATSIRSLNLYKDFLKRLIDDDRFRSYKKKTIFIPVLDWNYNNSLRMWIYKEDMNPIAIIYNMMRSNPQELKRLFKDIDIIFMGSHNYFKINFNEVDFGRDNVAMKYVALIKRIVQLGNNGVPDDDPIDEPENSPKGIAMDIVDKIEKSQNIDIKSVKPIMDIKPKDLLKPEELKPDIAVKKVDADKTMIRPTVIKTATKTTVTVKTTPEDKEKATKVDKPFIDPAVNAVPIDTEKENLVTMVAKAAEDSNNSDEAIEKLDDETFKLLLSYLKDQEEDNIRVSKARAARIVELSQDFQTKEINGKSVKDLLEENPNDLNLPATTLPVNTINDNWKDLTFMNFDKEYDPDADIVKMLNAMKDWSYPVAVRNITVTDNSTSEDYVNLWDIDCEDFKGTRFKLKIDIPQFINDKFLKLRGNEKSLMIQSTLMPVLKTDLDTCQIIGVGGYNKIFVRRYGSGAGKSMPIVDRLIKTLNKYDGKDIQITFGDNTKICNKYDLPIDYIDLASYYDKIETPNLILYFNQDELRKEYEVDDSKGLAIGIRKINYNSKKNDQEVVIYYDKSVANGGFNTISKYIMYTIFGDLSNPSEIIGISNSILVTGKRYMYSRASILSVKIPLVVVCSYVEGLSATLRKANIEFSFKQSLDKVDKVQDDLDYIQFSDGYLMYQVSYESSMLMNGLKECNTQSYSIKDINSKEMYMDFLTDFGGNLKADGLENSYDCMIDPITKEILEVYKLPTDYVSILLYANALLADNKFIRHTDMTARRLRRKELIAGYFYKALTMSYQSYANQIRHTRKSVKMTMKQSSVIDMILSRDPSTNDLSVNNLINDIEAANTITNKGLVGMNTDRAYSLDKRGYDESMLNILGMSTGFSGTVGINRQATIDCNIVGTRGFIKPIDGNIEKFSSAKTLTMTEALTPFGSTHDDPFRTLMTFIQTSKHMVRTTISDPLLVTNGADEAVAYMTSDIFAFKAKKDGVVKEIVIDEKSPKNSYMILAYNDGEYDYIDLSENIKKNSDGGYSVPMKLDTDMKAGQKIKAGDIAAYDKLSFSNSIGENDNIAANIGTLAKVAILNTDEGFEDSAAITERFAGKLGTDVIVKHDKTIDKSSNVFLMKKIGDTVMEGDTLLSYQASFDDDVVNSLLKNLSMSEDEISELGRNPVKSHYTGILQDIKVYRTVELDELSPSLQALVKMYEAPINKMKKVYKQYGINAATLPSTQKLDNTGKTKNVYDGVLIEFYIKYNDEMSIGDKVVFYSANKGIIKYIIPEGSEPHTDFRPEEKIDAFVSIGSINGRMVCSTPIYGAMAKLMIELDRSCKDIAGIKYDTTSI